MTAGRRSRLEAGRRSSAARGAAPGSGSERDDASALKKSDLNWRRPSGSSGRWFDDTRGTLPAVVRCRNYRMLRKTELPRHTARRARRCEPGRWRLRTEYRRHRGSGQTRRIARGSPGSVAPGTHRLARPHRLLRPGRDRRRHAVALRQHARGFAIRVIWTVGEHGAPEEATRALRAVRPRLSPALQGDVDWAIASLKTAQKRDAAASPRPAAPRSRRRSREAREAPRSRRRPAAAPASSRIEGPAARPRRSARMPELGADRAGSTSRYR